MQEGPTGFSSDGFIYVCHHAFAVVLSFRDRKLVGWHNQLWRQDVDWQNISHGLHVCSV
jgi:hypothetical protein